MNPVGLIREAQIKEENNGAPVVKVKRGQTWTAVAELVFVGMLINLLTDLAVLGPGPAYGDVYVSCIKALLTGAYLYVRARDLNIDVMRDDG